MKFPVILDGSLIFDRNATVDKKISLAFRLILLVKILLLTTLPFGAYASVERIFKFYVDEKILFELPLANIEIIREPQDIQINRFSTLIEIDRSEQALRQRFINRAPSELTEYLVSRGFQCGNMRTSESANIFMSCRRSWPGSWWPFLFAQSTTIMFRGRPDSIESIEIVAKSDNFP